MCFYLTIQFIIMIQINNLVNNNLYTVYCMENYVIFFNI